MFDWFFLWCQEFFLEIHDVFIVDDRWMYLVEGLEVTLTVTFFALILGSVIGFFIAMVRTTYDKTGKLGFLNVLAKIYLTVIRGTPVTVQLMIIYFVIFASVDVGKLFVAVVAFGLNSGAYVAEIFRSGIMSIDAGQMEAGRSLGLTYNQSMIKLILPQAIKNVLPALANEFIVLLKETSICSFIALNDVMRGGDIIRAATYNARLPLFAAALIYLVLVIVLQYFVGKFERSLRKSDRS